MGPKLRTQAIPAGAMAEAPDRPIDRLCRIAARLLGTPMAAVTLVGDDHVLMLAACGLPPLTIDRPGFFCGETVGTDAALVVPDALADPRFRTTRLVTGPPRLRFYAGIPLHDATGRPIGTLSCMDPAPHPAGVAPADLAALADLALLVVEAMQRDAATDHLAGQLRAVVEAIPLPLLTIDSAGTVTGWNPAAEQVFGWTAAEAIGRFGPHVPPDDITAARALRAMHGKRLVGVEAERIRRDGSRLPVAISTAPLRDASGRPDGAVVIIEDISARRRTEAETAARTARAARQAALLARIATAMPTAGEDLSAAMRGIAAAAAQGLEGCEAGAWLTTPGTADLCLAAAVTGPDGAPLPPGTPQHHALQRLPISPGLAAALLADRRIAANDAATDRRLGELRAGWITPLGIGALLAAPIRAGQEVLGLLAAWTTTGPRGWTAEESAFIASLGDLAAVALEAGRRARAMDRLAEEKNRAEAASRAKTLFLGTLSHELRTPLNAIIGFSDLLQQPGLTEEHRLEFAGHVVSAGHHLLGVFTAMLDQARVESGALTLAEAPIALPALLDEATVLVLAEATGRRIAIHRRVEGEPPPLRADAGMLRQAIGNLLANAVKFSPEGGLVELGAAFDPMAGYRIWVGDQGPGIAAADLPRAFEPFRQIDEGHGRRSGGAGLGLPLARAFTEAHGGTLTLDSSPGHGTRVTLTLPAGRALPAAA